MRLLMATCVAMLLSIFAGCSGLTESDNPCAGDNCPVAAPSDQAELYAEPMSVDELEQYQACLEDADCIFINNGCCDCANGGEEAAINEALQENFEARFDCEGVACTMMARIPACGTGTIACVDGMCAYTPPEGVEE